MSQLLNYVTNKMPLSNFEINIKPVSNTDWMLFNTRQYLKADQLDS